MKRFIRAVVWGLVLVAGVGSVAQPPQFRTRRALEFYLAEHEAGPGLVPVHIEGRAEIIYLHPEVRLDDRDIRSASVVKDVAELPAVQVRLTAEGVKKFNAMTVGNRYKMVAIAANNKVIMAPVITDEQGLIDDRLDITGDFTSAEAAALAKSLNK